MTPPHATFPDFPDNLTLDVEGHRLVTPCLEVTIYFQRAPVAHLKDMADKAVAALDGDLTHFVTGSMKRFAKRGKKSEDVLATMFDRPRVGAQYWMLMRGTDTGVSAAELDIVFQPLEPLPTSGPDLEARLELHRERYEDGNWIFYDSVDMIRVTFPLDHPLAAPEALRDWVLSLTCVREASFVSGHAGFGLNIDEEVGSRDLRRMMDAHRAAAFARHPGLDYHSYGDVGRHLVKYWPGHAAFLPRIKRVQWLTLVNDLMLDELCGGREAIETALAAAPDAIPHALAGGGLLIQAGERPGTGDVTRGDRLPAYRTVAQLLAPARLPAVKSRNRIFDQAAATAWLEALESPIDD